uniref:DUF6729 domain-containing protein n=1 Tax=Nothobranchius kuhntae TaxID=321403 RepID=A0A1A8J5S9_NOTKU
MTSPVIRIVNPGAPLNRQQAVLLATKESGLYRDKKLWFPVPHPELLYQATALECAEKLLRADGVSSPTQQQRLGKLVRHICDLSSWYTLLTEVLCCGPCTKAAGAGGGGAVGRWPAWDPAVVSQLSEAHQALFPAVLTSECGVDKNVVRLFRDRTEDNAMVKVTQRHNKYKKKTFCPVKKMSTSKGLTGIKFECFEDFKLAVDSKDAAV